MRKLDLAKKRDEEKKAQEELTAKFVLDNSPQLEGLKKVEKAIASLYELINGQEPLDLSELEKQLVTLNGRLDLTEAFQGLTKAVEGSKTETVGIKDFSALLAAVKANKPVPIPNVDFSSLEKAIIEVQQKVQEASLPNQAPEEYTAVRRVIKVGNLLVFDDQQTPSRGGGGGGGSSQSDSGTIVFGGTGVNVKHEKIAASSSGDNTIVSAVAGKKILVLSYVLISNGTVNVKWTCASGDMTGLFYLIANTGASSGYNEKGHFKSATSEALVLNLSGNVAVGGHLTYAEV